MVRDQDGPTLTIGAFAKAGGVGVETVRYYQRRGLLPKPPGAGIRRYGAEDQRRLRFIRAAQGAGFTLEEIGDLLALDADQDRARARATALAQLDVLDRRIADLQEARAALARLARTCGEGGIGPCPILEAFGADPALTTADAAGRRRGDPAGGARARRR